MNDTTESVQVRLERTALLNARELLDKMETEQKQRLGWRGALLVVVGSIVLLVVLMMLVGPFRIGARKPPVASPASVGLPDTAAMTREAYLDHVMKRMAAEANQPQHLSWRGGARASAVLDVQLEGGYAKKITVATSSGDKMLDNRYMTAVKQAEPYGIARDFTRFKVKMQVDPADNLLKPELVAE